MSFVRMQEKINVRTAVEQSLKNLKIETIDLFFVFNLLHLCNTTPLFKYVYVSYRTKALLCPHSLRVA